MFNQEELQRNAVAFLVTLRRTEWADYRKYMTSDLMGIGPINQQALQTHLYELLDVQNETPTVENFLAAWNTCIELGELVEPARVQAQVVQQEPQVKSETERQAEIIAKEISLMKKQRRQEAWKPSGPSMQEKAEQLVKDESDWQSFRSEIGTAQTINVIGYQGNINWAATNAARSEAIRTCKDNWIKKCPNLAEKIQQYSTTAPTTSGGFVPLPLNASVQAMKQATPEQLRDLAQRQRAAKLPQTDPDNDA